MCRGPLCRGQKGELTMPCSSNELGFITNKYIGWLFIYHSSFSLPYLPGIVHDSPLALSTFLFVQTPGAQKDKALSDQ